MRRMRLIAALVALTWCLLPTVAMAEPVTLGILFIAAEFALPYAATSVLLFAGQVAVAVGLSIGISAVSALLTKKKAVAEQQTIYQAPAPQDVQQTIRQSVAPRRRHYGRGKTGGVMAFYQSKDGKLYGLILVAQGEIADFEEYWLNDQPVTLDVDGFVIEDQYQYGGTSRVQILTRLGTDDQLAYQELIDAFPDQWTDEHRLRGIASVLVIYQDVPNAAFSGMYPQGPPSFRAVIAAALVDDPRSGSPITHAWSDNPALCILDFMTHADGMGRPASMFDADSFAAAADVCDQQILIAASGSPASYEPRYSMLCSYDLAEKPSDVVQRMLAVCDGEFYQLQDGSYGLRVGQWDAPTVTIEDGDALSYQMEQGSDALSAFNRLKLIYVSSDHDYQETEAEAWEDADNIAETGETKNEELRLLCCPSPSQARRLGKIAMARSNARWKGMVRVKPGPGLRAMGERIVTLTLSEMEISETFNVQKFSMPADDSFVDLAVTSLASTAYDWDPATEEGTPPPIPDNIPARPAVPVPTGLSVIPASISIGGVNGPVLTATWDAPARETTLHEINYRPVGATDWISQSLAAGVTSWVSNIVEDGVDFEVRLRARSVTGRASEWTDPPEEVTTTADTTAPGQPTGFGSSKLTDDVTLNWTNPNSANFFKTVVYRNTVNVFGSASVITTLFGGTGAAKSYADNNLANGTYYWWVQAFNASNVSSTQVGSTTQTIP